MPTRGVLLAVVLSLVFFVAVLAGTVFSLDVSSLEPDSGGPPTAPGGFPEHVVPAEPEPIIELGDTGWLHRTLTVEAVGETVTVELRIVWADGAGHIHVEGRDADGRYDEVVTDEVRAGSELEASLAHFQRMYDELRLAGGVVELDGAVTVAHQTIDTPDGAAVDVWRIGEGDPDW